MKKRENDRRGFYMGICIINSEGEAKYGQENEELRVVAFARCHNSSGAIYIGLVPARYSLFPCFLFLFIEVLMYRRLK